ncbi:undecaprenyl-diphosphate phosphatase [Mangrovibacillus cuniculi]|uniref:Undecaprenyl-diphosphatase n=1 Tax=Mangrovibacillus cuniculi TaxID=2593652 RepID=A0A7S8CAU9_9BACI|nr:undecaprenyl-diphosphate phosphatase [Mangrovibacillus cuniculi]QPC46592.1 undecaprenyl-diphosphate phosphatase [Mangrovibacillus cuniculi]
MVSWLEAFILGIIQGLTEFLPISSTGHLYIGRHLFGLDDAGLFLDTMLHIGTLLAIIVVYKEVLLSLLKNPFQRLTLLLIVATLPAVIVGLLFEDYFEAISKSGVTLGWEFLITGCLLYWGDKWKEGKKEIEDLSMKDAAIIGSFQAAAIFPALSRSGLTIVAGLFTGLKKETAAYFSFLLATPAILGGIILQGRYLFVETNTTIGLFPLLIGTLASCLVGYLAIVGMIHYLKTRPLRYFAYYVWILGVFILLFQWFGIF